MNNDKTSNNYQNVIKYISEYMEIYREGGENYKNIWTSASKPDKLYKFYSLNDDFLDEKKFKTLRENQIWLSHVGEFNDPYEFKALNLGKRIKGENDDIQFARKNLNLRDIGVCCFTMNDYNFLPMWAYYTNNYKGFCVEYQIHKYAKHYFREVLYLEKKISIDNLINYCSKCFGESTEEKQDWILEFLLFNFHIKCNSWSHEKEYRFIKYLEENNCKTQKGEKIKIENVGLKATKIIVGINCSKENINELKEISNKLNCQFKMAKQGKTDFKFVLQRG